MAKLPTRARRAAIGRLPSARVELTSINAVRASSASCRVNPNYAHAIDTLEVRLNKEDFIVAFDDMVTILRQAVNIGVLMLFVDRLPRSIQDDLLDAVHLPNLWSLSICSSSQQTLRRLLHNHRHTMRHLRIEDCRKHAIVETIDGLPLLTLNSITGPINCVAEVLPHCANTGDLTIWLTSGVCASSMRLHGATFQPYFVTELLVVVRPRDYAVVRALASHFPHVERLNIVESHRGSTHVWYDTRAWAATLHGFHGLSRLVLQIPRAISVKRVRVRAWFPRSGTNLRDIEFRSAAGYQGAWKRDHGSDYWYAL